MSEFKVPAFYVVPSGNTLPTTGSTEALTDGQFGVFKDDARTAATAANIGTAAFIQFSQGRKGYGLPSKYSGKIKLSNVTRFEKLTASTTKANQIMEFSSFSIKPGEDVTLTLRGFGYYPNILSANGFTRSITIPAACITCGADPCTAVAPEPVVDAIIQKYNDIAATQTDPESVNITTFWTLRKSGTGNSVKLIVEGKPSLTYSKFSDVNNQSFMQDRFWFRGWVHKDTPTAVDFESVSPCDVVATSAVTQRSSFVCGTADEVRQMQIDFYSYLYPVKNLSSIPNYNPYYVDLVDDSLSYDIYWIHFKELNRQDAFNESINHEHSVIIAVPTGSLSTGLTTVLTAYLGAPVDESGATITTTTTTSTTTTSTTTTTTLIP